MSAVLLLRTNVTCLRLYSFQHIVLFFFAKHSPEIRRVIKSTCRTFQSMRGQRAYGSFSCPHAGIHACTHVRSCNRKRLVRTRIYNEVRWDHRTMPTQPIASQAVGLATTTKRACKYNARSLARSLAHTSVKSRHHALKLALVLSTFFFF